MERHATDNGPELPAAGHSGTWLGSTRFFGEGLVGPHMREGKLRVFFITPGGTARRGGMGRMAQYLTQAFQRWHPTIRVRVLDSYGPGSTALMPFYFLKCFIALGVLRLVRPPDVVHLNMAAYGSTLRKLLLLRLAHAFRVTTILHIHAVPHLGLLLAFPLKWCRYCNLTSFPAQPGD